MAKVRENLSFGDEDSITLKDLIAIVDDAYRDLAIAVNQKPDVYVKSSDGQTTDSFLSIGDININSSKVEIITAHPTPSTVTWTTIS